MKKGFTLIELLVVVLIIGILSAVALPQYTKAVEKSRVSEAKILLKSLSDAEDLYVLSNGDLCGTWKLEDLDITLPGTTKDVGGRTHVTTKNFEIYADECAYGNDPGGGHALDLYADRIDKDYSVRFVGGNYDGGDHTISGLRIGSEDAPADQMASGLFGLTAGELSTNDLPTDQRMVTLKNIHLADIAIYVATRYETFTGGLVGSAQNGIYIDNCSVTGVMNVATSESFARAGGLAASVLRGAVTNSWTDVDITAATDTNHVYAGGLYGMDLSLIHI